MKLKNIISIAVVAIVLAACNQGGQTESSEVVRPSSLINTPAVGGRFYLSGIVDTLAVSRVVAADAGFGFNLSPTKSYITINSIPDAPLTLLTIETTDGNYEIGRAHV